MNRIYRLVWSESLGAFIPAAEITRRRGKRSGRGKALAGALVAGAVSLSAFGANAGPPTKVTMATNPVLPTALPTAPHVTAGQANVSAKGNQMTVTEATPTAAINWATFDIGSAAGVTFVQPTSSSVVLNRVLSANPSQIFGTLTANGIVFLINPQGVLVGKGAEVNVGGLVASTLNLSDKDLLAGNWAFTGLSALGAVSNAGAIHVTPGGFAALIGARVDNSGSISAKLGSVALASGNQVTLDFDEAGLLKVAVKQAALDALVSNAGAIVADGGRVILTAKSADQVLGTVVNNSGVLQAQSLGVRDGQVWLLAADEVSNTGVNGAAANAGRVQAAAGGVVSSGTIDVSGKDGAVAGQATLAGTTVTVAGSIDAGNAAGGAGRVLVDSTQGTTLTASSRIDVSSTAAPGKVIAWSDGNTTALGAVDGRGLGASGRGATVEVSAAHDLSFVARVELGAVTPAKAGTLILDPATLEIASGTGTAVDTVYQSALQTQSGNIVLSASGQITIDPMTNNVLDLANASGLSITSQSSGGIQFRNGVGGAPSGITTHDAPVTLTASGSGAIDNVGDIKTNGGDIKLSGVFVHLTGGLDATNGQGAAGNVAVSVFGGAILSSSASPIAGGQVLLDATYGYIGSASAPVPTATTDLRVKTGGNAYVANAGALDSLALTSNHLEGTPVGIGITATNLHMTGADATGDGTMYSNAVRWTEFSAGNPSLSLAGPAALAITEDGNLLAGIINLPQTAVALTSAQGYILGGNGAPVIASSLNLASSLGIGGADFNGINAETDEGNLGTRGGNTLLTQAGTITANVLDPAGNITGIVNLTQQGDLLGSVQANGVLLQASGDIGSAQQPFAVSTGGYGEAYNVTAAGNIRLDAGFLGAVTLDSVQAGGTLAVQTTVVPGGEGGNAYFNQVTAGGNLTLTGMQNSYLRVNSAVSTNGSIAISNDYALEVDAATLNGTDAVNRSIALTALDGTMTFGALSTNGDAFASAAAAPLGSISIASPQGQINDTARPGVLRAGNATLSASSRIRINRTNVDTHTNLTITGGQPGNGGSSMDVYLTGIDSVSDPNGADPHSIHLVDATNYYGRVRVYNYNGDLLVGNVRSYFDFGGGDSSAGTIYLHASGSIVADGSDGGGRINAADLNGNNGYISLGANGSLGLRGTGADGTIGASALSLSGNRLYLGTNSDLFVNNDQSYVQNLNLSLNYASGTTPYFYHFTSADAAEALAATPAVTFHAASSNGLLTVKSGSIDDSESSVNLYTDGNVRVQSFQAGQYSSLGIYGQDIVIDAPINNMPALSMGDGSWLRLQSNGSLTVGNLASTGTSGNSYVGLFAYGGNLTLGRVDAANANVEVDANSGDILGAAGNRVLAHNLTLTNSFGAIGADPLADGSIPINVGVTQSLSISNEGGGGSINLITLNDPGSLNLTLYNSNSPVYTGANFLIAPSTTGLGLSGSAVTGALTLASLGTTGGNPNAVPVSITSDTPNLSIISGAGAQLGIGYDLYFGNSYQSVVTDLSGSAGQNVVIHTNNASSPMNSLTGELSLTNLVLDASLYSWGSPLAVNLTLAQPLSAFTLVRNGSDSNPTSFNGNSIGLSGSGQSFTAVEISGTNGSAPGTMTVNAASASALDLTVDLQTAGLMEVGTINLGQQGSVTLSTHIGSLPFIGVTSAIEGVDLANVIEAASVNLSSTGSYAGQATLGLSTTALNVIATNLALTSTGDIYINGGLELASLAVTVSHPQQDTSGNFTGNSSNYVYQIAGSTALAATDNAASTATSIDNFASSTPLNFAFTTDRTIQVGDINVGSGSVTLTANGNWNSYPYYNRTPIGIEQIGGGGIVAGSVTLNANGYRGHAGTTGTALQVNTANLSVSVNGDINVADSSALDSLSLSLRHGYDANLQYTPNNSYAITAPNIALTLVDQYNNGFAAVALQNLVSSSLQSFSLTLNDANMSVGTYGGDYSGGQVSLGSSATVNLATSGSLWGVVGGGGSYLSDAAGSAVADSAVAIKVGTLNLTAGGNVTFSAWGSGDVVSDSLPVEVANLSVSANGSAYITNVGNLNVVSTNIGGSGYLRAVEAAPAVSASITGGTANAPLAAGDLTLVAYYGDIGAAGAPVITNTASLSLDSGADIYAANQSQLATLSIISHHNKDSIGDTSNDGLNTLDVTDTSTTGGTPLQLGVTDLGAVGGYQLTGLLAPQLNFAFQTDNGISVGTLTANSVALTSETGGILHIPSGGTITAGSVSFSTLTAGQSIGAAGEDMLVDAPSLSVRTGGSMYVADSAALDALSFSIGSVMDKVNTQSIAPVYHLDNSATASPLHFDVTADTVNNVLDVNSIAVSRTDAPVSITVYTPSSGIGVGQISDSLVAGGTVNVWSDSSGNVFGLAATPASISATTVNLMARYGSIGTDFGSNAAPVVVLADNVGALSSGDIRITSPQAIANLTLQEYSTNPAQGSTWVVTTPDFALTGLTGPSGTLDIGSVSGTATNLEVDSGAPLTIGTLALGRGSLNLNTNYLDWHSINSDGSNGNTANITTTGNVALNALTGIGNTAEITTDISGNVSLSTQAGGIYVDQISNKDLVITNLAAGIYYGDSPISITAEGNMTLVNGMSAGNGNSSVALTAGGDINYAGGQLTLYGSGMALSAGGNIVGGDIWQASSVSLIAAGAAAGSTGSISIGSVDGAYWNTASGAITLQAAGDVTLYGQLVSANSVSIASTNGSIFGEGYGTFSVTPNITLRAHGDIGSGSTGDVSQWALNNGYQNNPGTVTLSAQAGGQINLLSYAAVNATQLSGGGNVSLQVLSDGWHTSNTGVSFGQVSSTNGSVYLATANGDITASGNESVITAATSITLNAAQSNYFYNSGTPVNQAFNLGASDEPLSLTAPQINLTANGNVYAIVPTIGLADLSVARTYVQYNGNTPGKQAVLMPASTVLIEDTSTNTVLGVTDGGWTQGGSSAVHASYGTALNLNYAGNNAIQLGTVNLSGGNLSLQATNPFDISITSTGGLIQANVFNFNLIDGNQIDGTNGTASGGFGTAVNPIRTQIGSLSGTTVGPTAGVFMNQTGAITFTNLATGGDISVTTTRLNGAVPANADIALGNVSSHGSVSFTADGAILAANGVDSPGIHADGDVALSAATDITLRSSNVSANGNVSLHAGGGIDLTAAGLQSGWASQVTLTADQGDISVGSINSGGWVALTATNGAINGTAPSQNLTGLPNGITANADIILDAATGIGTAGVPLSLNTTTALGNMIMANTAADGADMHLVTGSTSPLNSVYFNANTGGTLTLNNYYHTLILDDVQSQGDIQVTQQNYYGQIVLNNVAATNPGATLSVSTPYGNIASWNPSGAVSASRIVLNALGDSSGGTLGQSYSPVNVDADVVIAVASGDISLNSVATGATKMPLVASNGFAPTVSIASAGDFQVGQIVAGQQGTVNIDSAANILDDGDSTTQIYSGAVNLTAAGAIGTSETAVQLTTTAYDDTGATLPGTISAASTTAGNINLIQQGDAVLQSLTAANGSINVFINDAPHGQSTLVYADTTATDRTGNDINIALAGGDLTVDQAKAGMAHGAVNLYTPGGSIYGDGRADCCTTPNVSGNGVSVTAGVNVGSILNLESLSGTALGIQANSSNVTTYADGSRINLQYVGDVTVGSAGSNNVSPLGGNAQVLLAACGNLTLTGLNLTGVRLGLTAGTGGNGGSVLDGINGGGSLLTPDVTAASVTFGAASNVGDPNGALWVDAPTIAASAANGGVWINTVPTTPVTLASVTAGSGPAVLTSQGEMRVGAIDAGSNNVMLTSVHGAILDGANGGSNIDSPNVNADIVTLNAATNAGSANDALWVNAATINATATSGGVWINDAAATPVTVATVTAGAGPVVIGGQGDLLLNSINANSGSVTLNSVTGAVLDGISGGSGANHPNVIASSVTVDAATNAGGPTDALWVNAATINATATDGGVWINDAATTPVTIASVTAGGGPVVIGGQGDLKVGAVNAGGFNATLTSANGAVLDGRGGGSNLSHPNITAAAVTIDASANTGSASDALWINATTLTAAAANGGVWINDAATAALTVESVVAGNGPVVIGGQGTLSVNVVDAGVRSATLTSVTGSLFDGNSSGADAGHPNVIASSVSLNAGAKVGSLNGSLWVDAATVSGAAGNGGVWVNDAATTPVTIASVTSSAGPVVINGQGDLKVKSINAGSGSVTLDSANGGVLDGTVGGSNASRPNVTAGSVTVNSATNGGNAAHALWVDATRIAATATNGGVWINDAATSPATVTSVTAGNGPVVIGSTGNLLVDYVNAGDHGATLSSSGGAVQDGVSGGSSAAHPNVIAATVTVNSGTNAGNAAHALWVDATTISGSATTGGVWINDAAAGPVTVASITAGAGPVVIVGRGDLDVHTINAGSGSVTLDSVAGAVLDGTGGAANAARPNVTAGSLTVNSATGGGNAGDALWVDAPVITATATGGGMWIKDAASTPVTVTVTAGAGPVVIGSRGNLLVGAVNAGSDSATLSSANGAVLDGTGGAANAAHPNVTAGSVTVNSATGGGNAGDALWVDAAAIAATATGGGVWIKDAATTPVTVTVTAGAGPVVINGRGDLLVQSVNAGGDSATLNSATGAVLDGINGGSSASHPNVTANAVTVNAATNAGDPNDSLWVNAATIAATATRGGVWINDAARTPVTLANVTAGAGPVVIGSQGDLVLGKIDAGASDVTLGSVAGSILDGISGHASTANPNVTGALVTLNAAKTVGSIYDRVYVNALTIDSSAATGDQFINTPPTPYPAIPLVTGVSPVTVYSAYAEAQVQPPQQLPITLIGQPLRMAPPIDVTANLFGIALPVGVDSTATQQDTKLDTASKPIEGGNDDEIGRKKSTLKLKKQTLNQSKRKVAKQPRWEG